MFVSGRVGASRPPGFCAGTAAPAVPCRATPASCRSGFGLTGWRNPAAAPTPGNSRLQCRYLRRPTIAFSPELPKDYNPSSESLPNRAHQGRHEVHMHALCSQRQHSRFRCHGRQPAHSSRNRHQRSRHQDAPRAHATFLFRQSAAHLALELLALSPRSICETRTSQC